MRTCWVLDHPAHVRLLAEFLRNGTTADLIVALVAGLALTYLQTSINARLMHYISLVQTIAHATFKALLAWQFVQPPGQRNPWPLTFLPIYIYISISIDIIE